LIRFPFAADRLPFTGIYFFYETGETWGHGGEQGRIVRVGSSRPGNLRNRINEHYLLDESRMTFSKDRPKPSDRSIFRKNIGRALLYGAGDEYLEVWEMDFTTTKKRESAAHLRHMNKERRLEAEITRILRNTFSFRFITMEGQAQTMGTRGLEGPIVGTLARCRWCSPSSGWLGRHSPKPRIAGSGLWQEQHLSDEELNDAGRAVFLTALTRTKEVWGTH